MQLLLTRPLPLPINPGQRTGLRSLLPNLQGSHSPQNPHKEKEPSILVADRRLYGNVTFGQLLVTNEHLETAGCNSAGLLSVLLQGAPDEMLLPRLPVSLQFGDKLLEVVAASGDASWNTTFSSLHRALYSHWGRVFLGFKISSTGHRGRHEALLSLSLLLYITNQTSFALRREAAGEYRMGLSWTKQKTKS